MTHHCRSRELTVAMTAAYEMDESDVAFVTGSGENTNKVESIVEDAEELRTEAIEEHAGGAFEVPEGYERDDAGDVASQPETDGDAADDGPEKDNGNDDEAQAGLGDFV